MRLHFLQHVPFEDLGQIETWARSQEADISQTRLFLREDLPAVESIDWLVVLGGPMNVYEDRRYPWLLTEKKYIEEAVRKKRTVLGICLGAQLVIDVLGSPVSGHSHKEIGWFPVSLTEEGARHLFFRNLPPEFMAFHWHGDTFQIPRGCVHLASSEACPNQAFAYEHHVLGIQFHVEYSSESVRKMIRHCAGDLTEGEFVQTEEGMLTHEAYFPKIYQVLHTILDNLAHRETEHG